MGLTVIALYVFPDGRFIPGWSRLLAVAAIPAMAVQLDAFEALLWLPDPLIGIPPWRWWLLVLTVSVLVLSGVGAQAYRYRYVSGSVERQQTKWIVFALAGWLLVIFVGVVLPSLFVNVATSLFAWLILATPAFAILLPVAITNAILRYGLYDTDRIISRTLAFALLTGILDLLYAGTVVALGQLVGRGRSSLAVAGATLAVAAASSSWSTVASTAAATTRPGPSRRSARACGPRSTSRRSPPTCLAWWTRPSNRPRPPSG